MFRGFGQIGTKYGRGSPAGSRNPPKSLVTGPSLLVNCYLKIKFHKKYPLSPPPPPPPPPIPQPKCGRDPAGHIRNIYKYVRAMHLPRRINYTYTLDINLARSI